MPFTGKAQPLPLRLGEMVENSRKTPASPSFEEVQRAAYFRHLERGSLHGHDTEDWLKAETALREAYQKFLFTEMGCVFAKLKARFFPSCHPALPSTGNEQNQARRQAVLGSIGMHLDRGEFDEAMAELRLLNGEDDFAVETMRFLVLQATGEWDQAMVKASEGKTASIEAEACYQLACLAYHNKRIGSAFAWLNAAIELNSELRSRAKDDPCLTHLLDSGQPNDPAS